MNLYALFRLLWCPAKILTPIGLVLTALFVTLAQEILNIDSPDRAGALAALLFPALAGFVIGQAVGELESCSFSWTLPGLHRKLLSSVMLTGVVAVLAGVGLHIALGGSYGPAMFGLAALGFSLGLAVATPYVLGGASARFGASSLLPPVAIVLTFIFIDRIAALCQAHPIPWFIVGVTGSALYLWRRFDPAAAKARLSPADSSSALFSSRPRPVAPAGRTGPSWDRPYLGTSTANWIRAGAHENFGMKRLWLLRVILLHALVGPIVISASAWFLGIGNLPLESDQILYWLVFVPPGHATPLVSGRFSSFNSFNVPSSFSRRLRSSANLAFNAGSSCSDARRMYSLITLRTTGSSSSERPEPFSASNASFSSAIPSHPKKKSAAVPPHLGTARRLSHLPRLTRYRASISRITSRFVSWLAPSRYCSATRFCTSVSNRLDGIPAC